MGGGHRELGIGDGSVSGFDADALGAQLAFSSASRSLGSFRDKSVLGRRTQAREFFENEKEAEIARLRAKKKLN
jgi:hypothetical protein